MRPIASDSERTGNQKLREGNSYSRTFKTRQAIYTGEAWDLEEEIGHLHRRGVGPTREVSDEQGERPLYKKEAPHP